MHVPERAPFTGRVEGSSPHPPLEGQSEERCIYSDLSSDVLGWYVFQVNLVLVIYIYPHLSGSIFDGWEA